MTFAKNNKIKECKMLSAKYVTKFLKSKQGNNIVFKYLLIVYNQRMNMEKSV